MDKSDYVVKITSENKLIQKTRKIRLKLSCEKKNRIEENRIKMDADRILEKCGDFGYYQLMMLGLFGVINILASVHYYSQTIISFIPDHW